jgi:hypothetical protein
MIDNKKGITFLIPFKLLFCSPFYLYVSILFSMSSNCDFNALS